MGLLLSSEQAGDAAAATAEYADFLAAWKNADPSIAQLTHAQTYVAEHRPVTPSFKILGDYWRNHAFANPSVSQWRFHDSWCVTVDGAFFSTSGSA